MKNYLLFITIVSRRACRKCNCNSTLPATFFADAAGNLLIKFISFILILLSSFTSFAQKCGVLTFTVTVLPDIVSPTNCQGHFRVDATFNPTAPDYKCSCCEFRQMIKGTYYKDGNKITAKILGPVGPGPHPAFLPTGAPTQKINLSETAYKEDYNDYGDGPGRYGHRNEGSFSEDHYKKGGAGPNANDIDAAGGCTYYMSDKPGFENCDPTHSYKIDLYFKDSILTTCELCDGCKAIESNIVAERPAPAAPNPPPPPAPKPKKGIGPDFTSLGIFFILATAWIVVKIRRRNRVTI
jgi:hypothetical protein